MRLSLVTATLAVAKSVQDRADAFPSALALQGAIVFTVVFDAASRIIELKVLTLFAIGRGNHDRSGVVFGAWRRDRLLRCRLQPEIGKSADGCGNQQGPNEQRRPAFRRRAGRRVFADRCHVVLRQDHADK